MLHNINLKNILSLLPISVASYQYKQLAPEIGLQPKMTDVDLPVGGLHWGSRGQCVHGPGHPGAADHVVLRYGLLIGQFWSQDLNTGL